MKIYKSFFLYIYFTVLFVGFSSSNMQDIEYLAKASYIEKFSRFTQWPKEKELSSFVIVVFGKSQINKPLEMIAKNYKIKNKTIQIFQTTDIDEIENCNLLFISSSEASRINKIITRFENHPILIIGESEGFCRKGGHLNFYNTEKGTIYFEINPERIKASGLTVDLYLIQLGKIITS